MEVNSSNESEVTLDTVRNGCFWGNISSVFEGYILKFVNDRHYAWIKSFSYTRRINIRPKSNGNAFMLCMRRSAKDDIIYKTIFHECRRFLCSPLCEEGKFTIADLKKSHDTLAGLLEEARKQYGFEAYLSLEKVGSALKNDLRKAAMDADKYGLCRKLLEEPAPPGFYILRKKKGRKKINYAGLNNMYESFMQKQFKWKREERLYSRLLGMVNLLAIIIKGQYLKNQSTEVAHSWMWHVNRQEAEAILRSEPTRKPGYFCVRQRADIDFENKPFAITYIKAIQDERVIFDHLIIFWSYEDGFYIENGKSKGTLTDLVYSLSKRVMFRVDPDEDIEDVMSEPDIPSTAVVKTPLEHRETSYLDLYKLLVNFKNPYYHNKKLAKANYH